MKSKNALCNLSIAVVLLLGVLAVSAQTTKYLYTGSETNITLPHGTYIITAYGAQGGTGVDASSGLGAEMEGEFNFTEATTLTLLVGGGGGNADCGGGGGGSFVVNASTPLVVAGGGGGSGSDGLNGGPGLTGGTGGTGGGYYPGGGGSSGGGGGGAYIYAGGGGGGGYSGSGGAGINDFGTDSGTGGYSYLSGGAGGSPGTYGASGGYGGGGGSSYPGGGGGGGYSGGGGSGDGGGGGGGGGSIIDSSAITNLAEVSGVASPDDSPNGEIIITAVPALTLTNIVVSPANPIIGVNGNETFTATGYFSDGSMSTLLPADLIWSSSNPGVATINTNGVATGLTGGTTTITATVGSVSNNATLTVQLLLSGQTNVFLYTGVETSVILLPGTYIITAYGAQGGYGGGLGAEMEGEFNITNAITLTILVGGAGGSSGEYCGGGGGGSFVVNASTPMVIAGGGGGGSYFNGSGLNGTTNTSGENASSGSLSGDGGSNGSGGYGGSGNGGDGGGFYSDGSAGADGAGGGGSFADGGGGGAASSIGGGVGGYGGGGGGYQFIGAGGGGGYSGGGGADDGAAGGGGSIIDSSAITNLAEVSGIASPDDSPNGEIIITVVPVVSVARVSSLPVALWPASATNYVLQMTTNLVTGPWVTVTSGIPFSGLQITNAPRAGFFLSTAQTSTTLGIAAASSLPVIVWPAATTNFVLQTTTNLVTGPWVTVTNGIPFSGLQITNAPHTTYFRLQ